MSDDEYDSYEEEPQQLEPIPEEGVEKVNAPKPKPKKKTSSAKLEQLKKAREAKQRKRDARLKQKDEPPPPQPELELEQPPVETVYVNPGTRLRNRLLMFLYGSKLCLKCIFTTYLYEESCLD
jgi:hypothetical protein